MNYQELICQVKRCYRLANYVNDRVMREKLLDLAKQYERQADDISADNKCAPENKAK